MAPERSRGYGRPRQRGVTLIEVLITLVIVLVGVLALFKFKAGLYANQAFTSARASAQALALDRVSQAAAALTPHTIGSGAESRDGVAQTFNLAWDAALTTQRDVYVVSKVDWLDSRGKSALVAMATLVTPDAALHEAGLLSAAGDLGTMPGEGSTPPWETPPTTPQDPGPQPTEPPDPIPGPGPVEDDGPSTLVIRGSIVLGAGADLSMVKVHGTAGANCSITGLSYSCTVARNWSGQIKAMSSGKQVVDPATQHFTKVTGSVTGQTLIVRKR